MNKIFIKAYLKKNLGDDLFLKILSDRYQDQFFAICNPKYKYSNVYKNIKFNHSYISYYIIRILEKITKKNIQIPFAIKKSSLIINIGGSIFMEPRNKSSLNELLSIYNNEKDLYILGANFGPFQTQQYKKDIEEKVLKKAKDVCFREEYSYNLFKNIPNVRYASDIVFSLNTHDIKITNNKKVVISIIDIEKKVDVKYKEEYEKKIIDLIHYFYNKKYEVILMSFCKSEGDEKAIEHIIKKVGDIKLKKYYYNGNIKEALNVIGDSQIIIGSRFHANILGMVMNKTVIPIAYSDKTTNVLNDINFKGKIYDIRNSKNFSIDNLTEKDLNYKIDISLQKQESERQFEKLDKILIKREKDKNE